MMGSAAALSRRTVTVPSRRTVHGWLNFSRDRLPPQEGLHLLAHLLRRERATLLAHGEMRLSRYQLRRLQDWVKERQRHLPLAQLTHRQLFHGLDLYIDDRVLTPRPETEGLVDVVLEKLVDDERATVWDMGTGSGCIALAVQAARPKVQVMGVDVSLAALAVAVSNGRRLRLPVIWLAASWLAAIASSARAHIIVANPPYIAPDDPHLHQLIHEPHQALVAQQRGLADLHLLIGGAMNHLHPGGYLILEHGFDQGPAVRAAFAAAGWQEVETRKDLAGHPRVSLGRAR